MKGAQYSALSVANYFLGLAQKEEIGLFLMKLQKLIYFAHGWHLAIYKAPLISDQLEALDYGPVVSSIYHEFKRFGGSLIEGFATDFDWEENEITTPRIPMDDSQTIALLNKVWSVYGKYTSIQLSNLTHEENSAWSLARLASPNVRTVAITDEMITKDFSSKITSAS